MGLGAPARGGSAMKRKEGMRNPLWRNLAALAIGAACLVPASARAVTISLLPALQSVQLGQTFDVQVVIAGLGAGAAPTLAGFDLDVAFAPDVLALAGVTFGDELGEPGVDAFTSFGVLGGPARVDLAAASLLPDATLDADQPAGFVLATLHLTALAVGQSALAITQAILADTAGGPGGNQIPLESSAGASVDVLVPEPGTALLLAAGCGLLGLRRRERV
jgi:hypothetical protein